MKKNIIMALCTIATMHTILPNQSSVQPQTSLVKSGVNAAINAVDTTVRATASTAAGMATGILSAYGVKAVLQLLHMDNQITPKTGAVFALLTLGVMSKEYSLRNKFTNILTKHVDRDKKTFIENIGNTASWIGFLLVGLNPNSMFPTL